ncbi:hypothetical protein [Marinospirillum insulare]|uniref:Preprotein translocase subunit SecB n=1 Tax=Marinospirillum insulare TaxID=217169 RepID=A0ABQ5ZW45_9GAMM|nr:hypothetical protein [Marinospirillum insulare]GLR64389.1 hypothetical protein GCM10007878_18270 [Marinospirillum insulare]
MKNSAIQLKHYHFTKLVLEVNENFQAADSAVDEMYLVPDTKKIRTNIIVKQPEALPEGEAYFNAIELKFSFEENDFPYSFDVELFGVVSCTEALNEQDNKHNHLFVVNSVSMLYSAIRDQLLTLSARYQHGPMMLPSLDFRGLEKAVS